MAELAQAQHHHELDWRSLLSSQREVADQIADGAEPHIEDFWETDAQPRSEELTSRCLHIVDAHLLLLWDAIEVFVEGVRPALAINGAPASAEAMESLRSDVERLIQPVSTAAPDRSMLDELGERWQERMRRQAIRRYIRTGGLAESDISEPVGFSAAIDALELKMLNQAPWAHADQLLTAFEVAHAEIRRAIAERLERMLSDLLCL